MKIGINSRIYQINNTGIPYYIECLYKKLLKEYSKNEYVFFQTQQNKKIGRTETIPLKNKLLNAFLFDNFFVNRLIEKENIDVFHGPASILPFFKKKNIKYVVTVHDLSFLIFKNNHSRLFTMYYKYFVGRSLKISDVIVADSVNTKKDIIKFYTINEKKIHVIYPGVNEIFAKRSKAKRLIDDPYFLTITTHPKRKNIYRILKLLSQHKELKKYKFVIAGLIPEDQKKSLEIMITELKLEKYILIYGYASEEDLINLYSNAYFFIYPSYYEGFGFPVLEAMMCRTLVLASSAGSIPEITPNNEWLFNPQNTDDIIQKINKALTLSNSKKEQIIDDNYHFAKRFSWDNTAKEMVRLFRYEI